VADGSPAGLIPVCPEVSSSVADAAHQITAESTGTKRSSVSIVFGYGTISTRVTLTEANPARDSMIWSFEPVI
jgi:hypothetical protein